MIKLQHIGDEITNLPIDETPVEKMKEFLDLLVDITNKNMNASTRVEDATKRLLTEIEFMGIDFSEYLSKLPTHKE
jgi:hypothetical protein